MAKVRKLCPTVKELDTEIQRNVPCLVHRQGITCVKSVNRTPLPLKINKRYEAKYGYGARPTGALGLVTGCDRIFSQGAARRLHMVKVHKFIETDADRAMYTRTKKKREGGDDVIDEFHCPVTSCYFNITSPRHFTSFTNLKNHYMRVHGEKQFECETCNNKYRLERDLRYHQRMCNLNFYCRGCNSFFDTMNKLTVHKETVHSEGISYIKDPPPIVLPVRKTDSSNVETKKGAAMAEGGGAARVDGEGATNSDTKSPKKERHDKSTRNQHVGGGGGGGGKNRRTETSTSSDVAAGGRDAEALHTLASIAVERENNSTRGTPVTDARDASATTHPYKVIVVGSNHVPVHPGIKCPDSSRVPAYPGIPILPKPHTLLLPLECDIQDGNKFIIKTGPTVGICDPSPVRVPSYLNNNVLKPLKPKPPTITDTGANLTSLKKDQSPVTSTPTVETSERSSSPEVKKDAISIGIQTSNVRKSKSIAGAQTVKKTKIVMETETQTSGDYILRKAMKSANITTQNKSCGTHRMYKSSSQNSTQTTDEVHKKSLKRRSRTKSTNSSTQTFEEPPTKKHRPRRTKTVAWQTEPEEMPLPSNQAVQSIQTVHTGALLGPVLSVGEIHPHPPRPSTSSTQTQIDTSFTSDALQLSSIETQTLEPSSIETQTLQSLGLSRSTTETQTLWDELEKTLAESISTQTFQDPLGESTSTQTFDSFLSANNSLISDSFGTNPGTVHRDDTSTVTGTNFMAQSQNESFNPSFSRDPIIGSSSSHVTNMGHFGVQTDESPLSNFLSSSVQTSLFDDTTAFTSIETQTVDDMFEQLLSNMHTQTTSNFLDSLELTDIQTQTNVTMEMDSSFETSTQTQVSMETSFGSSHAESQTSVTMDTSYPSLDMETQTVVTMDTINCTAENETQTLRAQTQQLSTAETQTQVLSSRTMGTQSVGTSSLVQLAETETQTLLETLGLNGDPIHSQTQTSWT